MATKNEQLGAEEAWGERGQWANQVGDMQERGSPVRRAGSGGGDAFMKGGVANKAMVCCDSIQWVFDCLV